MKRISISNVALPLVASCIMVACAEKAVMLPAMKEVSFAEAPQDYQLASNFKNIRMVQLESTDSCIIADIRETHSADGKLFVLTDNDEIFCFDENTGKFITQIGSIGEGPGEYINATSIFLDEDNKTLSVVDNVKNTIVTYTIDGKYVSKDKPDVSFAWVDRAVKSDDGYLMMSTQLSGGVPASDYGYITIGPDGTTGQIDPFAPVTVAGFAMSVSSHPMSKTDDGVRFFKFLNDTIFTLSEGQAIPYLKLNFDHKLPTKEVLAKMNDVPDPDINLYRLKNSGYLPRLDRMFETKDLMVIVPIFYTETGYYWIEKDKAQGVHVASSKLVRDEVKWVLEGKSIINIVGSDNDRLICEFKDLTIEAFKRLIKEDKDIKIFNKELKTFFENADPEGNPCLIFYEH